MSGLVSGAEAASGLELEQLDIETNMRKFWDSSSAASAGTLAGDGASLKPVPKTLQIGSVMISPATVLAPMAGVTHTMFRRFIRSTDLFGTCGVAL